MRDAVLLPESLLTSVRTQSLSRTSRLQKGKSLPHIFNGNRIFFQDIFHLICYRTEIKDLFLVGGLLVLTGDCLFAVLLSSNHISVLFTETWAALRGQASCQGHTGRLWLSWKGDFAQINSRQVAAPTIFFPHHRNSSTACAGRPL